MRDLTYIPFEWKYDVSVPLCDIAEHLSEDEYEFYKDKYKNGIPITIIYDFEPAQPEVGIMSDELTYADWDVKYLIPQAINNAVDQYVQTNSEQYSKDAYSRLCDYMGWSNK